MSDLTDRIAALAALQLKRSGVARRYRPVDCRSLDDRRALFERLRRDDAGLVDVLRVLTDVFGRGAVAQIDVVEGVVADVVGVVPLPVVDVRRESGTRCCYWVDDIGSVDGA